MSERVLVRLHRMNKTGVFLAVAALVVIGLFLPGIAGSAVLLALAAGLIWLLSRTWAVTSTRMRIPRVIILALLVAIAAFKAS